MLRKLLASLLVIPLALAFTSSETLAKADRGRVQERELRCLAENIYYEAANQSLRGQIAVAYVTLNRVNHPSYPRSICGVVYQQSEEQICQFSWVCSRLYDDTFRAKKNKEKYDEVVRVARNVLATYGTKHAKDPTHGALYYHATYVNPRWSLMKTVQIGDHIFYRNIKKA